MVKSPPQLEPMGSNGKRLRASGAWTIEYADDLGQFSAADDAVAIDAGSIDRLDTLGAWTVERLSRDAAGAGRTLELANVPERYRGLLDEMRGLLREPIRKGHRPGGPLTALEQIGRRTTRLSVEFCTMLAMAGAFCSTFAAAVISPRRFRPTSIVHHLDRVGWQAIGIILLITFLIGAIIAQQGIFNFRRFGADDYVVNLVGILVLREIGVLIVAIMVAGRSGSSYTAELGSMKMREEIDALRTMGIDPVEILVMPRVIALIVALPLLTFIGSMAALFGGGLVAEFYGGMSPVIYVSRLRDAVSIHDFYIGMIKAPVMAAIIGIVACSAGFRVTGSTESLGLRTTASVVTSIFLVIVLDGFFAIFFASIGW